MSAKDGTPRIGRPPIVSHGQGVRHQLGIIVSAELKERIRIRSEFNGTSMSAEAEHIMLQGLAVIDMLDFFRKTLR